MEINEGWTFKEVVNNIKALRQEYYDVLALFSIYEIKTKMKYIENTRDRFYKLHIPEWQIDKCWEFMNEDVRFYVLYKLANRQKR